MAPKEWLWEWHEGVTWYIEEISEYVVFPGMHEISAMLELVHKADGICCERPPLGMLTTPIKKEPIKKDETSKLKKNAEVIERYSPIYITYVYSFDY